MNVPKRLLLMKLIKIVNIVIQNVEIVKFLLLIALLALKINFYLKIKYLFLKIYIIYFHNIK
jgi:hypothetical protein